MRASSSRSKGAMSRPLPAGPAPRPPATLSSRPGRAPTGPRGPRDPRPRHRRDLELAPALRGVDRYVRVGRTEIGLRQQDAVRDAGQRGVVPPEFLTKQVVRRLRIRVVDGHEERERARALDVAEELRPQPAALVRPFDDPGDVRHHEGAAVAQPHNPRLGVSVVNGYAATLGRAAVTRARSVDFPRSVRRRDPHRR